MSLIKKFFFSFVCFWIFFILFGESALAQTTSYSLKKGSGGWLNNNSVSDTPGIFRSLGVSWFYNWGEGFQNDENAVPSNNIGFAIAQESCTEFIPLVHCHSNRDLVFYKLNRVINVLNKKGIYWLIGNEPDIFGQDGSCSVTDILAEYAIYAKEIQRLDSTAKLIMGGFGTTADNLSGPNPDAFNYGRVLKDKFLAEGVNIVKGWHIHIYNIYTVANLEFVLNRWKNWQNTVLGGGETWVTEYGVLAGTEDRSWMIPLFSNYLENSPLVQRHAWFNLNVGGIPGGLVNANGTLTTYGAEYQKIPAGGPTPPACISATSTPIPTGTTVPTGTNTPTSIACLRGPLGNIDCTDTGEIDASDLDILLQAWGTSVPTVAPGYPSADLDDSGEVDASDLDILLTNWGLGA